MGKAMTLRLDEERAAVLEMVARADDQSVTEAVRSAIDAHIEERRADKEFQERLARITKTHQATLERLAK